MEREEGELSDEDLEDVSDSSIVSLIMRDKVPIVSTGREPFRELSLTSISDDCSGSDVIVIPHKRYNYGRSHHRELYFTTKRYNKKIPQRKHERLKNNNWKKQCSSLSSSSESDDYITDRKILKQLRDAVRINSSKKIPNRSLSKRIKHMIQPSSPNHKNDSDDDIELEELRDQALQSKSKPDVIELVDNNTSQVSDEDLINLRLVALQSAVLKKHQLRRKKKEQEEQNTEESVKVSEENQQVDKNDSEVQPQQDENVIETEENDVKSSENQNEVNLDEEHKSSDEDDEDILRAMLLTSISKKIADTKVKSVERPTIAIKPIISTPKTNNNDKIKNTVNISPIKRIVINVNSDSDSDYEKTCTNKKETGKTKSNELFNKSLSIFLKQARAKSESEKSNDISKHLPRSQQLEYKILKRKLHQLSKIQSDLTNENNNKKIKLNPVIRKNIKIVNTEKMNTPNTNKKLTNSKERLAVGKYEELAPLMAKISAARKSRDSAQTEVQRLINELRAAKTRLTSTHRYYTVLVQQLIKAKAVVDNRDIQEKKEPNQVTNVTINKLPKKPQIRTSTPNRTNINQIPMEISGISQICEETKSEIEQIDNVALGTNIMPIIRECDEEEAEQTLKGNVSMEKSIDDMQVEPIEMKIVEEKIEGINKYISPLNHLNNDRYNDGGDPLVILCPYDLQGVCRDPDCSYRHCTKTVTD